MSDPAELRRRAEESLKEGQRGKKPETGAPWATEGTERLIQELQIHQIELEMQNEELRKSRAEAEALLDQYTDLYDLAPVGYLILDREGAIRRVNLTGTSLLGAERARLVNRRFGQFVSEADRFVFNGFLQKVFTKQDDASGKASCEVALNGQQDRTSVLESAGSRQNDGATRRYVYIEGTATEDGQECRAVITDITERKLADEKIKASLQEKETMLKEIHHRVKNNLQVISSMLNMQSALLPDETSRKMFQDSMDRVKTMAMIHTQLYQSQDLAKVDFGPFIRDLIGNINQSSGRALLLVEIHVDADEIHLAIDASIPCGLILNELVTNALKHAYPGGKEGEIHIRMRLEENQVILTVQDNGIGFPASIDFRKTQTLGLELVNLMVGQMDGTIDMRVDGGTTWTITFPIKNEREWKDG